MVPLIRTDEGGFFHWPNYSAKTVCIAPAGPKALEGGILRVLRFHVVFHDGHEHER